MIIKQAANTAVIIPAFGPEMVSVFGLVIPVMPFCLSMVGLILSRSIARTSRRKLSMKQEVSLTVLLVIMLLMIITGQFGGGPMKAGMACIWGIGLGLSGLAAVELVGQVVMTSLKTIVGGQK